MVGGALRIFIQCMVDKITGCFGKHLPGYAVWDQWISHCCDNPGSWGRAH